MHIRELTIKTSNLQELYEFYAEVLSLEVEDESPNDGQLIINVGNSVLIFEESNSIRNPVYHFAFNIPSNKIEEAHEWLKDKVNLIWLSDYNSNIAEFKGWKARSLYFYDPAGNIVEFIARTDLNDHSSAPFSELQIRNISEVGIVFPSNSYGDHVKDLLGKFGLSWFGKQPPMEQFCAVGDDEGLFIVVPENRAWYPTQDRQATIAPLKVKFLAGDKMYSFRQ